MGKASQLISLFFLTMLVLVKVSSLHAFAHQDAEAAFDHCAWCQLALETQHEEYLCPQVGSLPLAVVELPAYAAPVARETFPTLRACQFGRFCRPPPAIL